MAPLITQAHAVQAEANGYRFDIGQLSHSERAALERQTQRGAVVQVQALWPWLTQGSALQTCYSHPR
jgi:ABC-type arginine transport system ATPase subunit